MTEKRQTHRVEFDGSVTLRVGNSEKLCELIDISLLGAMIGNCADLAPELDSPCTLTLCLDDANSQKIIINGSIAHINDGRIGIHCTSIDIDSMTHLRKLVEYNLGDSNLLERDLATLIH